jgi:hypothetical protein
VSTGNDQQPVEEVLEGESEPLSWEERYYLCWARRTERQGIGVVDRALNRLATLTIALIGGGVVFVNDKIMSDPCKLVALVFFLISLAFTLYGLIPYDGRSVPYNPLAIKKHKSDALAWKACLVKIAGALLMGGLAVACVGVAARAFF